MAARFSLAPSWPAWARHSRIRTSCISSSTSVPRSWYFQHTRRTTPANRSSTRSRAGERESGEEAMCANLRGVGAAGKWLVTILWSRTERRSVVTRSRSE